MWLLAYVLNICIICNNIYITKKHLICNIFTDIMHMYMHIVSRRYNTEIAYFFLNIFKYFVTR